MTTTFFIGVITFIVCTFGLLAFKAGLFKNTDNHDFSIRNEVK